MNSNGHSRTPDCSADAISPCAFHCLRAVSIMMTSYTDKLLLLFISHIVMPGCFQIDDKVIVFHGSRRGSQGTVVSTGTESWRGWRSGRKISNDGRMSTLLQLQMCVANNKAIEGQQQPMIMREGPSGSSSGNNPRTSMFGMMEAVMRSSSRFH